MKKLYYFLTCLISLSATSLMAQNWLPVGSNTPFSGGTYSVDDKCYTLFRDTVNNVLITSGGFDSAGTAKINGCAAWNGSTWTKMGTKKVELGPFCWFNGELYSAGKFNDLASTGLCKFNGTDWVSVLETGEQIAALLVYKNELYVAGDFDGIGGVTSKNIAKFNGSTWSAVPGGISGSDVISELLIFNGNLIIGGQKELASYDGTTLTDIHYNLDAKITALAVYKSELYAGGSGGVAKLTGTSWTNIATGLDKAVMDLKEYNGSLFAGGQFSTLNTNIKKVAKWNGSTWTAVPQLPDVFSLAVYKNVLYAAGDAGIARLLDPTSVSEITTDINAEVWPNPTNGILNLEFSKEVKKASLLDLQGKLLQNIATTENQINLSNLPKGLYLLKLEGENGNSVQKISVQ